MEEFHVLLRVGQVYIYAGVTVLRLKYELPFFFNGWMCFVYSLPTNACTCTQLLQSEFWETQYITDITS